MQNKQPDYSRHKASFSLLAQIFPHIRPFALLFGSDKKFDRSNAVTGIIMLIARTVLALVIFFLLSAAFVWLDSYLPGYGIKDGLHKIAAIIVGLPVMLIVILSLNQAFDLFYLLVTGDEFDKAGNSLKSVKIFMLVFGFVGGLFLAGYGYYKYLMYDLERGWANEKIAEQNELLALMKKGRAIWNRQITSGPNEQIDLTGVDLSQKEFKGFFFGYADFTGCNLTDTVFDDCNLGYATFDEAVCHGTVFKNSYLYGAEFNKTDCKNIDLSNAAAVPQNFKGADIAEEELAKLVEPGRSRWHGVKWFDFHSDEWLREKGFYTDGRESMQLTF